MKTEKKKLTSRRRREEEEEKKREIREKSKRGCGGPGKPVTCGG